MPATTKPKGKCKPFSVNLGVLMPDNKRQVLFGVSKGCNDDDTAFWLLLFILKDKGDDEFQDRVKLEVNIGAADSDKADKLARNGLTVGQINFLTGPVTSKAKKLPGGTTSDPATAALIQKVLDVK